MKVLNRIVGVIEDGFAYEPDARRAEMIIRDLGLQEAKPLTTPWADEVYEGDEFVNMIGLRAISQYAQGRIS